MSSKTSTHKSNPRKNSNFVSPISIDLGAKNTGVYFAHYKAGSSPNEINKSGKVYQLDNKSYTLLMVNRTAKRHQRRGYDRKQMVKRLFKLIWEKHFKLTWDNNIQQSISFLLNRRGFTFLTEEYNKDILKEFPKEAYQELLDALQKNSDKQIQNIIKKFKNQNQDSYDLDSALMEWSQSDEGKKNLEYFISYNKSIWNFKINKFDIEKAVEKANFELPDKNEENYDKKYRQYVNTHLHHLFFAINKIYNELQSGSRHRSKYFEEVKNVLADKKNHTHRYLKQFVKKLHLGGYNNDVEKIDSDKLSNLISHLSNFELKPLRKYFNDIRHTKGDNWDEYKLSKIFNNWILNEWRVDFKKNIHKAQNKRVDYSNLKIKWNKYYDSSKKNIKIKANIIQFFLKEDPFLTIPPYQDNKNRRPPRCQSLILNPKYLDQHYNEWEQWLLELQKLDCVKSYLEDYEDELKRVKTSGWSKKESKNKKESKDKKSFSYFSGISDQKSNYQKDEKYLKARQLQFIFDRVKKDDPLNLNSIYSWCKKYRQSQSTNSEKDIAQNNLESVLTKNKLPSILKSTRDYKNNVFLDKSFLHLVCNYYKFRKRAKDGRMFIHPKYCYIKGLGYTNTGRFDDVHSLLTYCNRQPRHKRHQTLSDLADVLQVSPQKLKEFLKISDNTEADSKINEWLNSIKSLKTKCSDSAKEQKNRRGRLKSDIQFIYNELIKNELIDKTTYQKLKSDKQIKNCLKNLDKKEKENNKNKKYKDHKYLELYSLCEKAKKLCIALTKDLYNPAQQKKWEKILNRNPATAVYLLAQVNNIVFKDRSGNAKTCAVCSMDNAQRMQTVESSNATETQYFLPVKAQRLPAISTRIIDGAVMRLARIVGRAICDDKWEVIKSELEEDKKVCIPIITESNQFEFEPSREALVKEQRQGRRRAGSVLSREEAFKVENKIFENKETRIKKSNKENICPYKDVTISGKGHIDHIIPRSSKKHGVLNDEANLIYAFCEGNQHKNNQFLTLSGLHVKYKKSLFPNCNDQQIEDWIIKQIGDGEGENFKFGKYISFINLNLDQQKAFRHALFVESLRNKIINAIDNRNRAFVNGTQRYFAEVIANNLYKKVLAHNAKLKNKKSENKKINIKNLSFDYFGVPAISHLQMESIYDLRKKYEKAYSKVFKNYEKHPKESQKPFSHLIDAQLAFCLVADAHKKEGSLKINISDNCPLYPPKENKSKDKKKFEDTLFGKIYIRNNVVEQIVNLKRRKAYTVETHNRQLMQKKEKQNLLISYQIHRDSMISEKFIPLLKCKDGAFKKGFTIKNSIPFDKKNIDLLKPFLKKTKNKCADYSILIIDKRKAQNFLMEIGRKGATSNEQKTAKILNELSYQTLKKEIISKLTIPNKTPKTVKEAIDNWDKCIDIKDFIINKKNKKITLPIYNEWKNVKKALQMAEPTQNLQDFFKNNLFKNMHTNNDHNKVRQKFSLPVKIGIGNVRIKRSSWDGRDIIQISSEESLAKYGYDGNERPHTFLSKNSIPIKHYSGIPKKLKPYPLKWIDILKQDIIDKKILSAQVKNQDASRCCVKIQVQSIDHLSELKKLLSNQNIWKGKIIQYKEKDFLERLRLKIEKIKKARENLLAEKKEKKGSWTTEQSSDYSKLADDLQKVKSDIQSKNELEDNQKYHCLESKWFKQPFKLPKERNTVVIKKSKTQDNKTTYHLEFTIQKNADAKKWLNKNETSSNK